jgi:uncharacterized protein
MKALYITAAVSFSGKTALALGIGMKLESGGKTVGYFKPVSTDPAYLDGKTVDEDAIFVSKMLGLSDSSEVMAPVLVDDIMLDKLLSGSTKRDFVAEIKTAFAKVGQGKDFLVVEGGGSLREGYAVGLSPVRVIDTLDLPTLGVVRYRSNVMLIDDVLALRERITSGAREHLIGVVINSVPNEAMAAVRGKVIPYLEKEGVPIFGALPTQQTLLAVSISELTDALNAKLIVPAKTDALIENLSVGAMSVESAMGHFRRTLRKAVITGGDRADIQAAALETSTTALVLTGNLLPSSTILKHAEERGVAVLSVPYNTIEAVERAEKVFGKTRLSHPEKLARYREMLDQHLDWPRLYKAIGLK